MRNRLAPCIVAAMAVFTSNCHADSAAIIRFGVDATYAPFESKTPEGKLVGFDIDMGNEICARLKAKCLWVENDFDGMIPALKARKFDGIVSMGNTRQRAEQIAFSAKLYYTPTRLIAKRGSKLLPTTSSLAGKSIGVQQGTIQETYANAHWRQNGVRIVAYENQDQVYADLISGRLDATLQDAVQADYGFLRTPRGAAFAYAGNNIDDKATLGGEGAIGIRKQDIALKERIDQAIAGIIKDGTYRKIENRYFNIDVYGE
jgi:lysine/arginine/ornithine transport system substrate-binding protein